MATSVSTSRNYVKDNQRSASNNMLKDPDLIERPTSIDLKSKKLFLKFHIIKETEVQSRTVKIWICGLCKKEFKYQYTLLRHMPIHSDVRNYKCDLCPKAFRQLSTLTQHKATHTNKRPYVCKHCQKTFNRISALISHKKIHDSKKGFLCSKCGRGFHQKGNLRSHLFTHTNERPFKCDVCNKGFNQKSNLAGHKASIHGLKKPFQCKLCSSSFARQNSLNKHLVVSHQLKMTSIQQNSSSGMVIPAVLNEVSLQNIGPQLSEEDWKRSKDKFFNHPPTQSDQSTGLWPENNHLGNPWSVIIRRKPSILMKKFHKEGKILFIHLQEDGDPKICKASISCESYIVTRATIDDLALMMCGDLITVPIVLSIIMKHKGAENIVTKIIEHDEIEYMTFTKHNSDSGPWDRESQGTVSKIEEVDNDNTENGGDVFSSQLSSGALADITNVMNIDDDEIFLRSLSSFKTSSKSTKEKSSEDCGELESFKTEEVNNNILTTEESEIGMNKSQIDLLSQSSLSQFSFTSKWPAYPVKSEPLDYDEINYFRDNYSQPKNETQQSYPNPSFNSDEKNEMQESNEHYWNPYLSGGSNNEPLPPVNNEPENYRYSFQNEEDLYTYGGIYERGVFGFLNN